MKYELIFYGNKILREMSTDVDMITDETKEIVDEMIKIVKANHAYGLAAPQIGISKKIIVFVNETGDYCALINPEIVELSEETEMFKESNLSIPKISAKVERPVSAKIKATTMDNKTAYFDVEGIVCRTVLHEIDHLHGVLFIDKLKPFEKRFASKKIRLIPREIKKIMKMRKANNG